MRRRFALIAAALGAVAWGAQALWFDWVEDTHLPPVLAETSVEMRDRDGQILRAFDVENGRVRLAVRTGDVDPDFIDMLVAYEDKRFWRHGGVDLRAMARATLQAAWNGRVVSGGSTLTMQVARLLENGPTGSFQGKLRQMRVAWALEQRLSKSAILQLYLQHAPYGGRIEGVRSASLVWFGKEPRRLSTSEAALLVALPQAPEARRPDRFPRRAHAARDRVLSRLGHTSVAAAVPERMRPLPMQAPHLADMLRSTHPEATVINTTLDADLQAQATSLARAHLTGMPAGVSAAIVVADHQTGEIVARVGAPDYSDASGALGFVDMARASRSPGSTLKPVIYALAFDRGLAHPATLIADRPTRFGRYAPQNFDGAFRGDIAVRDALAQSLNVPVVALTDALGPDRLMAALRGLGADPVLPGDAPPGLAVALGGVGVSLDDLVQIYAGLARMGTATPLHVSQMPRRKDAQVIAARAAWQVGDILAGIPPPPGARGGLAYKTGTSYGHRDAWAIGYDGQHVVGVWIGRPDGTPVPGAFGGDHAAPLLFEMFGRLKATYVPLPPPPADTLILTQAELPMRLRRFGSAASRESGPEVLFPPDGAILASPATTLKVRGGTLPLTVMLNGMPVHIARRDRQIDLGQLDVGFSRISVVDARGHSARVTVEARP
ncbi:penicillin-binding protein 1C [Tateyamaria sp. SN6-1]|uniref:penicillin-binding protein 1C n=1 Tax=Tateyamaria sp. SN6-1 TaxID=3092148 RepID=UPI0039F4D6BD